MKKILLFAIAIALVLPVVPFAGNANLEIVKADGTTTLTKEVDIDGDNDFNDEGQTVTPGQLVTYRLNWTFNPGSQDVINPAVVEMFPAGTVYIPPASPQAGIQRTINGGATWTPGDFPVPVLTSGAEGIRWLYPSIFTGWTGANGSSWNRVQTIPPAQPVDINASRTSAGSPSAISEVWYDMKLDNNGWPCIVWQDNGDPRDTATRPRNTLPLANTHMYFIRWDGNQTRWECQDGSEYLPNTAFPYTAAMVATPNNIWVPQHPRLALDSLGDPHIVYDAWRPSSGGNWDIHFVHWSPSALNWINNTGGSPSSQSFVYARGENSYYPQIEMQSNDDAIISWFEETASGSNEYSIFVCEIPGSLGGETDLLGGNNISNYAITRTNGTRIGTTKSLALDNNQRPCLAFENGNPAEINFVRWNGTGWRTITNAVYATGNGNMTNTAAGDSVTPWLKMDNTNNPRISWCEIRGGQPNQICYLGYDSTDARWELADGTQYNSNTLNAAVYQGSRPSLDLDRNYRPHIAFAGGYMRWNGSAWVNGLDNPITTNATDGTGSLNTYNAPFNPIDVRLLTSAEKVAISTGLMDAGGMQDVAYIQRTLPVPMSGTYIFSLRPGPMLSLCNTASFVHSHPDLTTSTYSSNTVCNPMLEQEINKTAIKTDYMRDEDIEFDIFVNNPSGPITNCVVTDAIPANLVFKSASIVPTTITPTQLTFNMGNMPANSSFTIRVVFTLDPAYQFYNIPLTVTNTATFTCNQFPPRSDSAMTRIHETAMLFVKTANKLKYKPSEKVVYTIEVENLGTTPYYNVVVEDPIPADLILESVSPDVGVVIDGTWSYYIGDLNPGDRHVFTLTLGISKDSVRNAVRNDLASFNIINTATLRADGYEPFTSRAIITILLPKVSVQKFCKKFRMTPEETVTFTIVAKNVSEVEVTNTVLYDIFPHELIYSSAQPAGVAKPGKIVYDLGTFNPGETQRFDITFSVKHLEVWPETGIQVINTAILTCSELDDEIDHAMLVISPRKVTDPLQLVCKWINLDARTNILSGSELKLELNAVGGTSPYDYTIDWGDGTPKTLRTSMPESEIVKADHTYGSAGEYLVTIKCVDRGARTKILERRITVK